MEKRVKQFGGENRVFLTDELLNNIPESAKERLSDEALEALDILKEGFAELSPLERQVMGILVSESEMTQQKIAVIVGSTINGVDTAIRRAKKKLLEFARKNADGSIYIESMLKRLENDKEKTKQRTRITRKTGQS